MGGWLASAEACLPKGAAVGVDPRTVTIAAAKRMHSALSRSGLRLTAADNNPVDEAWASERPGVPSDPLRVHPDELAGESVTSKLNRLRESMRLHNASVLVVSALDEVAWLLNLRGSDVDCNPVFFGFVLVTAASHDSSSKGAAAVGVGASESSSASDSVDPSVDGVHLFLPAGKLELPPKDGMPPSVTAPAKHLADCGVTVHEYEAAYGAVEATAAWCEAQAAGELADGASAP